MRRADAQGALFSTVRTEGNLLPVDILTKIVSADAQIPGLLPTDYHLPKGEKLNEAINRSWIRLRTFWEKFNQQRALLSEVDTGTTLTREGLLLPLFSELGYGRLLLAKAEERTLGDKVFSISHFWNHSPLHLLGCQVDLDHKTKGVQGASQASPHSTVQDFLNRSDAHMWGFCSNGLRLRILRDNVSFSRQAFIEFDLESIFEGEVFSDFVLLWLLCHQSRVESDQQDKCWLEQWARSAQNQSVHALDTLRDSVQKAIEILGQGFLESHNPALKDSLRRNKLSRQDYFRQLLRLVYRLLFLFVAEDRNLLHAPHTPQPVKERYAKWHSTTRLRRLAGSMTGTNHRDMFEGLKYIMAYLGREQGCPELGLSPLGSFLWSAEAMPQISEAQLSNHHLLSALRTLAYTETQGLRRPVDYKNVGARELGSIYECLLELHPTLDSSSGYFRLETASGHERKTTGSYYTPPLLIENLLDSALEPVMTQAIVQGAAQGNAEQALLNLNICDPACGSGHFLIAAAHRLAKRLAGVRTGDEEPGPDAMRKALRDVIGRCIYGVDINPMAVELCKVSLWLEALEPGKPLSFLDHHIRCGNSLMGATPDLISGGLPDVAFKALNGDDKEACKALKKLNTSVKKEKSMPLLAHQQRLTQSILRDAAAMELLPSDSLNDIHSKETAFISLQQTKEFRDKRVLADMWCAAFVMHKYYPSKEGHPSLPSDIPFGITQRHINAFALGQGVKEELLEEVGRVAAQYQFFHWHLAFPEAFIRGGFDVMLGNPPWEHTELKEKEWFAEKNPAIANAQTGADRKRMIDALQQTDPELYKSFTNELRIRDGIGYFLAKSKRYPLCGRGRINLYAIFAELAHSFINDDGRMGIIVPSGIASDDTTKFFFQDMVSTKALVSLFDFENKGLFPAVDSRMKFCLLTSGQGGKPTAEQAEFVFFAHSVDALQDKERRFSLTPKDIELLNPNTGTCPIFRGRRDAELTKAIYRRVPVLIKESKGEQPEENPWGIRFKQGIFNMTSDSRLFIVREDLESEGYSLEGNIFKKLEYFTHEDGKPDARLKKYLPLYEAKMIHHFNHRWATYEGVDVRNSTLEELQDTNFVVLPRYWVAEEDVRSRLDAIGWPYKWLLGWRDICRSTDERTVIGGVFPLCAVGNKIPLLISSVALHYQFCMISCLNSYVHDYSSRQKIGGITLNFFIAQQLGVIQPKNFENLCSWDDKEKKWQWLLPRILELIYTAIDMEPFAHDCGYFGPPFRWDEDRRFLLKAELDAAFFHLYLPANADGTWQKAERESDAEFQALCSAFPTPRHAVDYIMETFPIVKRKDEAAHGEYRTKRVILEIYNAMQDAIRTGIAYKTRLTPPPVELTQAPTTLPQPEQNETYTPSPAMFPFWEREKRLAKGITALMRDNAGRGFDEYFDAMLLATNPEICAALLPTHRQAGFAQALAATGLTSWSFPATDKVRYYKLKEYLKQRNIVIGGKGVCSLPANFDYKNAPRMEAIAPYLFEALQAANRVPAAGSVLAPAVESWKNTYIAIVVKEEAD